METVLSYLYAAACLDGYQIMSANSYFLACCMNSFSMRASLVPLVICYALETISPTIIYSGNYKATSLDK